MRIASYGTYFIINTNVCFVWFFCTYKENDSSYIVSFVVVMFNLSSPIEYGMYRITPPPGGRASSLSRLHDPLRHTTVGRTPLDE
jgi:hypothetical protein